MRMPAAPSKTDLSRGQPLRFTLVSRPGKPFRHPARSWTPALNSWAPGPWLGVAAIRTSFFDSAPRAGPARVTAAVAARNCRRDRGGRMNILRWVGAGIVPSLGRVGRPGGLLLVGADQQAGPVGVAGVNHDGDLGGGAGERPLGLSAGLGLDPLGLEHVGDDVGLGGAEGGI